VAPAYVVLALALPGPEVDPQLDAGSAVAERRRIRWLQDALDAFAGSAVLSVLDGRGGTALLPATPATVDAIDHALPGLLARLADATGVPVRAASAQAATPDVVPAGAGLAGEVLELVQRLDRPPGLYRLCDLLVEYQLTRPGPAHDELARRLDCIVDQVHLVDTLRAYLGHDRRRGRVADALHVHPNTVDYRLGRIAALTGLDPANPSDSQILRAALMVRDSSAPPGARGSSSDR
jgi:sugar diacid utilization regulator